ncbi:hypothetical protein ACEWY4_018099 [Coilia grayii]|uniref:Fibronectin type-III domain-containing protein n=1 Tax=Coilia grayii TaxID=363190 RepID=A0ABD1JK40_9TELE
MLMLSAFGALTLPLLVLAYKPQLCQPHTSPSFHECPALASLQCRNDYSTHIHCSWAQPSHGPLQLFHLALFRNRSTESPCIASPPPSQDAMGLHRAQCRYNTSMFVIHAKDFFFFKVPHVKLLTKTVDLHHPARMGPPRDLSVRVTGEGDWLLTWLSPPSSDPPEPLTYQVHYRQADQQWTELEVQAREVRLEASALEPDGEYSARVRVKGTQGAQSEWSSPVHWRHNGASLPGPCNFDCVLDGEKVRCSWELHRNLTQYVTYNLYYHINPTAQPQLCCPEPPGPLNRTDAVLRFSCTFSMANHSSLQVQLQAAPIRREFKSHKHIQPPRPTGVRVEDRGGDWRLSWTLPNLGTVPIATEIYYWSVDAPEYNKSFSLEAGINSHSIPTTTLRPSAQYMAKVRACVDTSRSSHYRGYPSLWSEPVNWTTRSGAHPRHLTFY